MTEPLRIVTQPTRVNEDIVRMFEDYLTRAKVGEFDGAAVFITRPDGTYATNYSDHMDTLRMLGALAHIEYRMHRNKDADGVATP